MRCGCGTPGKVRITAKFSGPRLSLEFDSLTLFLIMPILCQRVSLELILVKLFKITG